MNSKHHRLPDPTPDFPAPLAGNETCIPAFQTDPRKNARP